MEYTQIIQWVVWGIVLLYSVITTVIAIVNKIRKRKTAGEPIDMKTIYSDISSSIIESIKESEELFNSIAREGSKTGALKFNNVITVAERICNNKGIAFDFNYWSAFVEEVVSVMNVNKTQSSQLDKVANVQFFGGEK